MNTLHLMQASQPRPVLAQSTLTRAMDTARDVIATLARAGVGIHGLTGMCENGTPVIAIDPPGMALVFTLRITGMRIILRRETATHFERTWVAAFRGASLVWTTPLPKPRRRRAH